MGSEMCIRDSSGWDVSAGEDPSRTAYPAATCATGSLGLPTGGHALT